MRRKKLLITGLIIAAAAATFLAACSLDDNKPESEKTETVSENSEAKEGDSEEEKDSSGEDESDKKDDGDSENEPEKPVDGENTEKEPETDTSEGDEKPAENTEEDLTGLKEYKLKDMTYFLPQEFEDLVCLESREDTVSFFHIRSNEIAEQLYGKSNFCRLFTIKVYSDDSYKEIPSYRVIAEHGDDTYVLLYPSDVRYIDEESYDYVFDAGIDVTREELDDIREEYARLYDAADNLHERF